MNYLHFNQHITLLDGIEDIQPYFVKLPDPPPIKKFVNYGLPKEQQFFKKEHIPTKVRNLNKLTREEAIRVAEKDEDISSFIADQWNKRENGIWIIIYGQPMHITGVHWFYMNYFPLDTGLPDFRSTDRDYWYWRKFCVWDNPTSFGGINFTGRRFGKSSQAGCEMLEAISRTRKVLGGIQSKTDDDAKSFFKRFIVRQWRRLPFYFAPIFDGSTNPTSELQFIEPRKRNSDMSDVISEDDEPLDSGIDFRSSVATAYDGEKLFVFALDEAGKFVNADPYAIWDKVKYCLKNQDRIIGKALVTTTVEEMEKGGGRKFKDLWDDSSRIPEHKKINELGQTNSGLVPYFIPAQNGYIYDQYGFPIINDPLPHQQKYRYDQLVKTGMDEKIAYKQSNMGAIELLETELKSITDDQKRQDFKRKYPTSIKAAFTSAFKSSHFNTEKIEFALQKFIYGNPYNVVRGNFSWKDSIPDTEVIFSPSENGKFLISYLLPQSESNKFEIKNGKKSPLNAMKGIAGCDPFKYSKLSEFSNRPSRGAGYVWWYFDESVDGEKNDDTCVTDDFTIQYLFRPPSREIFNEDMLMMCVYCGIKINIERNVEHTLTHFVDRGYENYLLFPRYVKREGKKMVIKEKESAGSYSTGDKIKDPMFAHWEWYVNERIWRCKFKELIEDVRDVEYDDTRKSDGFMGGGYALLGAKMINKKLQPKKDNYSSPVKSHKAESF